MLQYKRILVPVDFSEISSLAIRKAMSARDVNQGNLMLAHIIDYLPPPYAAAEVPAIYVSEERMMERAEKHLSELATELHVGEHKQLVKFGRAKKELVEIIQNNDIDLVVMAAHSYGAVEKLLGSTTTRVIQKVQCDVLVIHG